MEPEVGEDDVKAARLAAFDALMRRRDAARTEDRHGAGRVIRMWGRPQRAEGCLLPDGTVTDATVVALPRDAHPGGLARALGDPVDPDDRDGQGGDADATGSTRRIDPEACVWSRRLASGGAVARRGRMRVEPGVALRFVDAPDAGEGWDGDTDGGATLPPSLERDLGLSPGVARRIPSDLFARLLYAALCNTEWRHRETGALWSCSWRAAGGVIAHLRGEGGYMDWYCSGGEGLVDEGVLAEVEALGWSLVCDAGGLVEDADRLPETTSGDAP